MGSFKADSCRFKKRRLALKTTSFKEQNPEKVDEFLYILNILKDLPVVYINETGIDCYLYRPYARAPRGEKVYEKISGLQLLQDK